MKTGLVLEGGAMRGLFSAGVMDVMMENGIRFDGIIGVSAGAAFGVNYKSGQMGRALRYNTRYCHGEILTPLSATQRHFISPARTWRAGSRSITNIAGERITDLIGFGRLPPFPWSRRSWRSTV